MSDSRPDISTDIAIVGGGLAGGLIALAMRRHAPDTRFILIDAGKTLGGNHRWSWFDSDMDVDGQDLLSTIHQTNWETGYDVEFPRYRRTLGTDYHSMA